MDVPAWQTDELGEEWIEASPSPPSSPPLRLNQDGTGSKRGSLRSLGHGSAARPLPPSRKGSTSSLPEMVRSPSNRYVRSMSGMLSPPTSVSSEGDDEVRERDRSVSAPASTKRGPGTFVVKEGEDTHGKAFPKNPFGAGKDMFAALPLERMFDPPSPVQALKAVVEESVEMPELPVPTPSRVEGDSTQFTPRSFSTTPTSSPSDGPGSRRTSHQYAPANPSRLSKSITPSDNSFSTTTADSSRAHTPTLPRDEGEEDMDLESVRDRTRHEDDMDLESIQDSRRQDYTEDFEHSEDEREDELDHREESPRDHFESVNLDTPRDQSPERYGNLRSGEVETDLPSDYQFTFEAQIPSKEDSPFEPDLGPLPGGEPSHSTLRLRPASANLGLRLFRNTYDTVTREHLSALVDSIAVKPSPSPPSMPNAKDLRDWSPPVDSPVRYDSDDMSTPGSGSSMSDTRSSKRLRMSPPSPQNRDWRARGLAMMDRLRVGDDVSNTSESRSSVRSYSERTWSVSDRSRSASQSASRSVSRSMSQENEPPREPSPEEDEPHPNKRSNPSTASSTYLHRAEDMMSRIKQRMVSPSTSTTEQSPKQERRPLSEADDITNTTTSDHTHSSSEAESHIPRVDASWHQALDDRPATSSSRASVEGAGPPPQAPINRDDLNRFISSSTVATATTVSTSFVKHAGPREKAGMRMIRPGDVTNVVPERIGKMRFDRATMRWVPDRRDSLGRVDEAGESRAGGSEDSVDPFAGIESIGSPSSAVVSPEKQASVSPQRLASVAPAKSPATRAVSDQSSSSEEDSPSDDPEATPRPAPRRPALGHSFSAPPAPSTPAAATPAPLRSALRNANSTPASIVKKRAAWHADLTPALQREGSAAPSSGSARRSVSFSEHIIAQDIQRLEISRRQADDDLFSDPGDVTTNNSWMPSARTKRIQHALDGMGDLSLDDGDHPSPSKPARDASRLPPPAGTAVTASPEARNDATDDESDDTVPVTSFANFRSFHRSGTRRRSDQTFLTECSFGVAHDRLVQLITDVQPFEPYWEQLRSIDLSNKGVESLARLKEFLPVLDEAKLNDNAIDFLSGIPSTVRTLHVAGNRLSSLTSVSHLRNLHFLDLSRNQLDSVNQLECLHHLRELVIDNNAVTDLAGLMDIDCLVKLSVSGNKISAVDLEHSKWTQLETLNLSRNRIQSIHGLHRLKALVTLNIDANKLTELEPMIPLSTVRTLRISDNSLTQLDLSLFPKVRTLFADNNALPALSRSAQGGHRIENLSLRNQRVQQFSLLPEDLQVVKRLYLSGNRLEPDFLHAPVYSLVYLEMAACNLSAWPAGLADKAPNLRILNANYNFLADLEALAGLTRLRKLMAVGCRLGAHGNAVRGLRGLSALEEVDLRMNPATLSFYLPILLPNAASAPATESGGDGSGGGSGGNKTDWPALDAQFRRQLPDEWYSRRLVYRGLVMAACADLRVLDGVRVEEGERRKAARLLEYAREAVDGAL